MSAGAIFVSTVPDTLKETLDDIVGDKTDGVESTVDMNDWLKIESMSDAFVDDLEMGGPGLLALKPEGQELQALTIQQGYVTRYWARTYGGRLLVTEEAMDDCKYDEVINAAKRLKRVAWKTADIDATNIAAQAFDTNVVGGDGLPLCSASHTLPAGGTFSNIMATPMSPSRLALQQLRTQAIQMVGHDGLIEGLQLKKIICPPAQELTWKGILGSEKVPESNNNEINTIRSLGLEVKALKYWTSSTTQWLVLTDNESKLRWKWRKRMSSRRWEENAQFVMQYAISYRSAKGWSDPRAVLGVNA